MSDQTEIFDSSTNPPADPPKDLVSELVGEGKKYKTVEELARGRIEADIHIKRLETEAAELRTKVAGSKAIEDVLEAVKAQAASANDNPDHSDAGGKNATPTGLTADDIAKIVAKEVTGLDSKKVRDANRNKADSKMRELFGDKAAEVYLKEASTPELKAIYRELAEVNPEKFISMFVKETPQSKMTDQSSRVISSMTPQVNPNNPEPGTQAFYAKLRKENPKLYMSAATQVKMHQDALANPDKYFGRKL